MIIHGELDPMIENITQFVFKSKREHIAKEKVSNLTYPNEKTVIEKPYCSKHHVIVEDTVKTTFNLDLESKHQV